MSQDKFFNRISEIDRLLIQHPIADSLERIKKLIEDEGVCKYFFDRLDAPEWIDPLKTEGFFTKPPKAEIDEVKGTISLPPWPESRYLARMAAIEPEKVLAIVLQIPDTNNVRVYEDLADVAIKMPPEISVRLLDKAKTWAGTKYQMSLTEKLAHFIVNLAKGGQTASALDLARVMFEILPDSHSKNDSEKEQKHSYPYEPKARFDNYQYNKILEKIMPELVRAGDFEALELFCDLLQSYIDLSGRNTKDNGFEDYSYIWRPSVEENEQNRGRRINHALVKAVRAGAEQIAQQDTSKVPVLIQTLERYPWKIFKRISLHILRLYSNVVPETAANYLTSMELFNDRCLEHEYSLLIREHFDNLTIAQKQKILSWIEQGPEVASYKQSRERRTGEKVTDDDNARYTKTWQLFRLNWIKESLPEGWKTYYDKLVSEYGEPKPEGRITCSWVGPTSPVNAENLKKMSIEELVEFLRTWAPPEGPFKSSPEGLGRELSAIATQNPETYAKNAHSFKELDPTYVRSLLSGLQSALKLGKYFQWKSVIDLCRWIMDQPHEIPGRPDKDFDMDPDWGWTRKAIAGLLSAGFDEEVGGFAIEDREIVWQILESLTDDPDPAPEDEEQYGDENLDPVTLSINTTRGEAMHAVVRYALWLRRYFDKQSDSPELISRGFDEMQEVRTMLERHLDVSKDPSIAIRAVYGQWFPWLVLLDSSWSAEQIFNIFPLDNLSEKYFYAAWNTYVVYCSVYDNVFELLTDQYKYAVKQIDIQGSGHSIYDADRHLAEHVMTLYWRGKLSGEETRVIFDQFWEKADPELRGDAVEYVGRSLYDYKQTVLPEILDRLKLFWEERLAAAKESAEHDKYKYEMREFGWWFASGVYDDCWALAQLIEAIRIAGKIEPEDEVLEKLEELAPSMPTETVTCLELMARGDREGWGVYGWRDHAKSILIKVLRSPAASAAEDFIHYLGSRGYLEFRELLKG